MRTSDDPLLTLAPIFGDVLTIRKPLARYRVHGANACAVAAFDADKLRARLHQDLDKAQLFTSACRQRGLAVRHDPLTRASHHLQYRFASYLIDPAAHPFPGDWLPLLIWQLIYSILRSSQMRGRDKLVLVAWAMACAIAPRAYRNHLVLWRFSSVGRPPIVRKLLGVFSSLRPPRRIDPRAHDRGPRTADLAGTSRL